MSKTADIYRIARSLSQEYGSLALSKVIEQIEHYTNIGDCCAIKTWYEIEDAVKELENAHKQTNIKEKIHAEEL